MTSKEFLSRAYRIKQSIKAKEDQIKQLRSLAERATTSYDAQRVSGTPQRSKMESAIGKIVSLENSIQDDVLALVRTHIEIREAIAQVENDTYRLLLELRYLNGMTWEQIAVEMNYSYKWVHVIHGNALKRVHRSTHSRDVIV